MEWTMAILGPRPPEAGMPPPAPVWDMAAIAKKLQMAAEIRREAGIGDDVSPNPVTGDIGQLLSLAGLWQSRDLPSGTPFQMRIGIAGDAHAAEAAAEAAQSGQVFLASAPYNDALNSAGKGYYEFQAVEGRAYWEYIYDNRLSRLDGPFREVFAAEMRGWVGPRRGMTHPPEIPAVANGLFGIALSGGGQRSAVFSLGVCQALARYGLLGQADYMATVSGGGYMGASIQSLCAEPVPYADVHQDSKDGRFGMEPRTFPYAFPRDPEPAPPPDLPIHGLESPALWHVRKYARLLGNRIGLLDATTWGTIYRYIGSLLISWIIFLLPIPVLLIVGGVWAWHGGNFWPFDTSGSEWFTIEDADGGLKVRWLRVLVPPTLVLMLTGVVYFLARKYIDPFGRKPVGAVLLLAVALVPLTWMVGLGLCGAVWLLENTSTAGVVFRSIFGAVGTIAAAATALGVTGTSRGSAGQGAGLVSKILLFLGGYVLLFVVATLLSWTVWRLEVNSFPLVVVVLIAGAFLIASLVPRNRLAAGILNWLSIGDLYRERLQKTWVISPNPPPPPDGPPPGPVPMIHRWSQVWVREDMRVAGLVEGDGPHTSPYPLFCATVNIPGSRGPRFAERKGDSFVIAPFHTGSSSTYWTKTGGGLHYKTMTIADAITISGAAFSPNMGEKTTRTYSILLTIFNARVGRWCDNPRIFGLKNRRALKLYYKELFSNPSRDDNQIYLSDGGHFENLGLYELVRRRCRYILVVTADTEKPVGEDRHGNLATAVRLVREDFGVQVDVPGLQAITRTEKGTILSAYAVGRVMYPRSPGESGVPQWDEGVIVVIKTGIVPDQLTVDLLSHWRDHADFPYTATLDQQYDQAQFESYRQLGYLAGRAVGRVSQSGSNDLDERFNAIARAFARDTKTQRVTW